MIVDSPVPITGKNIFTGTECCQGEKPVARYHPHTARFMALCDELKALHLSKTKDYGTADDPLANIRQGAEFVGIDPWRGAMVRLSDKVGRLSAYCRNGRLEHEGVEDTLLDLAAYALLALVLHEDGRPKDKRSTKEFGF